MIGVRGEEAGCEEAKRHPSPISPHHDLQCPASSRITPHRPASPASMSDNAYTDRRGTACGCPQRPALLPIAPQCPAMPCNVCIHHPCRTMHAPIVGAPLVGARSASPRSASPRIAHNAHIARIAPRAAESRLLAGEQRSPAFWRAGSVRTNGVPTARLQPGLRAGGGIPPSGRWTSLRVRADRRRTARLQPGLPVKWRSPAFRQAGGRVPPSGGRAAESRLLAGGRQAFGRAEDEQPGYSRDSR